VRVSVSHVIPLACALAASAVHAEDATQVYLSGKQLTYIGLLDEDANRKLFDLYDSVGDKPTELSIRSTGGEVNTGMALGRWVHAHHLDVKVLDYCLSSCANYVFPAGAHKTVSNFAMIGFHGGAGSEHLALSAEAEQQFNRMSPQERAAFVADLKAMGERNTRNEDRYFREIGVRRDMATLGQQPRYQDLRERAINSVGWTYTLENFQRLGVGNIDVINPPWKPLSPFKDANFVLLPLE
jgi:hypothetical protein